MHDGAGDEPDDIAGGQTGTTAGQGAAAPIPAPRAEDLSPASDEALAGRTVARWHGRLFECESAGIGDLWLLAPADAPPPPEFTMTRQNRRALRVPVHTVTEWFTVQARCTVRGDRDQRELQVLRIAAGTVSVFMAHRGPSDFAVRHRMTGYDDCWFGDFPRTAVDLSTRRVDRLTVPHHA